MPQSQGNTEIGTRYEEVEWRSIEDLNDKAHDARIGCEYLHSTNRCRIQAKGSTRVVFPHLAR